MSLGLQALVQLPNVMGGAGMVLAGRKKRIGWALGAASEVAWATWAYLSHNPGIYPWCAVWGVVYARNWWLWRRR